MISQSIHRGFSISLVSKLKDYSQLIKLRLTVVVVFSAAMGYLFAVTGTVDWMHFGILLLSGLLITGSANGINQIIEKDLDKLMTRTADRPIAAQRMEVLEAVLITSIMGIIGVSLMAIFMNPTAAILGMVSLLAYAFIYTPLKQKTSFAVLVGAFPGAFPVMIGYTAITGTIDMTCMLLFSIQFLWQFPHFWSIAWILDDDYKKAGFNLLPSKGGRNKNSALQTLLYALILIPVSLLPAKLGLINSYSSIIVLVCGLVFAFQAFNLYRDCSIKSAKQLMIGSFLYLPIVQLVLVLGKVF